MVKILILVGLVKLQLATRNPLLCAGIYAGVSFVLSLIFGHPFLAVLISSVIGFALALLYFALLNRFQDTGMFWVVLILGLVIGLV
jgi:hypothetical protein